MVTHAEVGPAVVSRVGAILRGVSSHQVDGVSTTQLAREVGLTRPTCHRLLSLLLTEGLIDRDRTTGRWRLGPETYLLGMRAAGRYGVTEQASAAVSRLAESTGESAFLSVRRGDETVCLLREDGSFPLRSHVLFEGIRFPLGVASAGMAILAHLPDREMHAYIERTDLAQTWGSEHAASPLRKRVAETRADGYATNPGLLVEGSWGMAAAVFDPDGSPSWALSLTGVESRFRASRRLELGRALLEEAHELTRSVGAARPVP